MPVCAKCNHMFPPNYVEVIRGSNPSLNGEYPKECVFCMRGIERVERETSRNSGEYIMYSKEECIRDYKEFLNKLKSSRKVQDIINYTVGG